MQRFNELLQSVTAVEKSKPFRRPTLGHVASEMTGLSAIDPVEDNKESSILNLRMSTYVDNLEKQDHRNPNKWRSRRVLLSGLVLSYFQGRVQKGAFSLKSPGTIVSAGRAFLAQHLEGYSCTDANALKELTTMQSPSGELYIIPSDSSNAFARSIPLQPYSFTVVSGDGHYVNFFAEDENKADEWIRMISHNLELSAKIASRNKEYHLSHHSRSALPSVREVDEV